MDKVFGVSIIKKQPGKFNIALNAKEEVLKMSRLETLLNRRPLEVVSLKFYVREEQAQFIDDVIYYRGEWSKASNIKDRLDLLNKYYVSLQKLTCLEFPCKRPVFMDVTNYKHLKILAQYDKDIKTLLNFKGECREKEALKKDIYRNYARYNNFIKSTYRNVEELAKKRFLECLSELLGETEIYIQQLHSAVIGGGRDNVKTLKKTASQNLALNRENELLLEGMNYLEQNNTQLLHKTGSLENDKNLLESNNSSLIQVIDGLNDKIEDYKKEVSFLLKENLNLTRGFNFFGSVFGDIIDIIYEHKKPSLSMSTEEFCAAYKYLTNLDGFTVRVIKEEFDEKLFQSEVKSLLKSLSFMGIERFVNFDKASMKIEQFEEEVHKIRIEAEEESNKQKEEIKTLNAELEKLKEKENRRIIEYPIKDFVKIFESRFEKKKADDFKTEEIARFISLFHNLNDFLKDVDSFVHLEAEVSRVTVVDGMMDLIDKKIIKIKKDFEEGEISEEVKDSKMTFWEEYGKAELSKLTDKAKNIKIV